jgi:hypothetical protein
VIGRAKYSRRLTSGASGSNDGLRLQIRLKRCELGHRSLQILGDLSGQLVGLGEVLGIIESLARVEDPDN